MTMVTFTDKHIFEHLENNILLINIYYRMTASAWDKFLLLSWKNWIIQLRHPIQTVFEVLVPVIVCALLILIRGLVDINEYTEDIKYEPFSTTFIGEVRLYKDVNLQLAYSPQNPVLQSLVNSVSLELNFTLPVAGIINSEELLNYAKSREPFASIEFDDDLKVRRNFSI